jgi:hypothetical protein
MAERGVTLASNVTEATGRTAALFLLLLLFCLPTSLQAGDGDEFTFELAEIEKKALQWGGYVELKYEHFTINSDTAMTRLSFPEDPPATIDRFSPAIQLEGSYSTGNASLNWLLKAGGSQDNFGWIDYADVYEAYGRIKPNRNSTIDLGKKAYKWGKGYAWNPVGFLNRPKDPNDPQEALEGYITGELDLIKSFSGSDELGNIALTTVLLPVYDSINDDFGSEDTLNLAAKIYCLYKNTDIDLLFFSGQSRSTRFGADFSRNVTPNFEIHAEAAYVFDEKKTVLYTDGTSQQLEENVFSGLFGLRYLTANELTTIIEYYHNGNGYTEEERTLFYRQVTDSQLQQDTQFGDDFLQRIRMLSLHGYGKPYVGQNYLYGKLSQKEPFAILYLTPALTTIVNLDDMSASISPEIAYTGFTNWEIRLRFSLLTGGSDTEYGEKQNSNKAEFRLRYFF